MLKNSSLLIFAVLFYSFKCQTEPELIVDPAPNMVNLGVSEEDQLSYIRKLALYHFRTLQWREQFNESACPEIETVIKSEDWGLCGDKCDPIPLEPEPPLTLCEINREYPGCLVDGKVDPDCEANPNLCLPPKYCDLPENLGVPECQVVPGEEEACEKGNDSLRCRWATKCDLDQYKDHPHCQWTNPCQADNRLCLTICDHRDHRDKVKCKV